MVVLAVYLVSGCSDDAPGASLPREATSSDASSPTPTTSSTVASAKPQRTRVPDVLGRSRDAAQTRLRAAGLEPRSIKVPGATCEPEGTVFEQRPAPGRTLPAGSVVVLRVNAEVDLEACDLDLPPASLDDQRVADLFVAFARGRRDSIPADAPVDVYLGGRLASTIDNDLLGERAEWGVCTEPGYAGRVCPLSPLDVLRDHRGELVVTSAPPSHPCLHGDQPLPDRDGVAVIAAATPRSCVDYFAVELGINDVGQIGRVNLVLTEP
ncbi:PASTA domain-containing protein [Nocardioides sp. YIM 123512]|uniref:PASTA domain-containing protein n=1 Tax=Nocardioides flavescens TaxID=2691959 RepID=A0A6L7F096_9ACTN|nr:PASTA domain-containing protein [Nocardioides flavescens]